MADGKDDMLNLREMLPDSISMEQIKQVMKKCILSETDNLFELLRVTINDDYLY